MVIYVIYKRKGSRSREAATQEHENGEAATQASETPDAL